MSEIFRTDIWAATDFIAVSGVNDGDPIGAPEALVHDDCYAIRPGAQPHRVTFSRDATGRLHIIAGGRGAARKTVMHPAGTITLMTEQNDILKIILLTDPARPGKKGTINMVVSAPVTPHVAWRIVEVSKRVCPQSLAAAGAAWFAAGTRVTLATGRLCPVQSLRAGDCILTRDNGPQTLRSVSRRTSPASGPDTAVRISAGVLNNPRPLTLSAANSLVLPGQRHPVTAGALMNRAGVIAERCGNTDYFTLHFDRPETVYAEGISAATSEDARVA